MGLKRVPALLWGPPGVGAKSNQGGIETVVGYGGVTYLVEGQNRTKVGLKPVAPWYASTPAHGAKSNQGGIETRRTFLRGAGFYAAKSNQGGIETRAQRRAA